jgi:hypothetical protein
MYKVEIFPDKRGHVQRDDKSEELEFKTISGLKTWVNKSCDLRHNVLTKAEYLTLLIEDLKAKSEVEFSSLRNATVIVTF